MSVRVEGLLDLPHADLSDVQTLHELLLFLKEHELCQELKDYKILFREGNLRIEHTQRDWSYLEISPEGKLFWDEHHKKTVEEKDAILRALREYYPMFRKALEIQAEVGGLMRYDKQRECIVLEVEE